MTNVKGETPKFDVVSIPLTHLLKEEEHLLSVDCQGGTLAQITSKGNLSIRDLENDEEEVTFSTTVKNAYKVFVHPGGEYIVVTATDGNVHLFSPFLDRVELKTSLCDRHGSRESHIPVGECVEWSQGNRSSVTLFIGARSYGHLYEVEFNPVEKSGKAKVLIQLPLRLATTPLCSVFVGVQKEYSTLIVSTEVQLFRVCAKGNDVGSLFTQLRQGVLQFSVVDAVTTDGIDPSRPNPGTLSIFRTSHGSPHAYAWCTRWGILHGLFDSQGNHTTWSVERWVMFPRTVEGSSRTPSWPPLGVGLLAFHMVFVSQSCVMVIHQPAGLPWYAAAASPAEVATKDNVTFQQLENRVVFDPFRHSTRPFSGLVYDHKERKCYVYGPQQLWSLSAYHEHLQQCPFFLERAVDIALPSALRTRLFAAATKLAPPHSDLKDNCLLLSAQFLLETPSTATTTTAVELLTQCSFDKAFDLLLRHSSAAVRLEFLCRVYSNLTKQFSKWDRSETAQVSRVLLMATVEYVRLERSGVDNGNDVFEMSKFLSNSIKSCPSVWKDASFTAVLFATLEEEEGLDLVVANASGDYLYLLSRYAALNQTKEAVEILCKHCHTEEPLVAAWYQYLPLLLPQFPVALTNGMVKCMMRDARAGRPVLLEAERLFPTLLRYRTTDNEDGSTENRVLYFLEQCIFRFDCPSPVVHNYYIYLLAVEKDEERLYEALTSSLFYDPEYALRVCVSQGCTGASFTLYKRLEMYEHAVRYLLDYTAPQDEEWKELTVVQDMLRGVASKLSPERAKNLWLLVVDYAFKKQGNKAALSVVTHSAGHLHIEDVLQFYDDDTLVADFKGPIQESLNQYSNDITVMKQKQKDVFETAEQVKKEITALNQQTELLEPNEQCSICHKTLRSRKHKRYIVYPGCRHLVHESCAIQRLENIGGIETFLSEDGISPQLLDDVHSLDDLVTFDCVVCGEAAIVELDIPLCEFDDSWDL